MTDEQHKHLLDVWAATNAEIQDILKTHGDLAQGNGLELVDIMLAENEALAHAVKKARRFILFAAGRPVEPETQFGEAVVHGIGAGGAL